MKRGALIAAAPFAGLFIVYLACLAPNWGAMSLFNTWDGLEYVVCANLLGIDHPPGHPAYMLLGKLFTMLPFGGPSWSINLLSAVFGAGTVAVLFLALVEMHAPSRRAGERGAPSCGPLREEWSGLLVALAAALTFAFSYVFWSHCEIPEVHTLFLFLTGASVLGVLKWHGGGREGWLAVSAGALGLALGVNLLGVLPVLIPVAAFALASARVRGVRPRWAVPAALLLAGALSYLYYPIRLAARPGIYSHPMNYLCPFEMGSAAWYRWFLSGKAWTGGTMFFLNRLLPNVPLYLTYAVPDVGYPLFALALAGIALAAADLHACVAALRRGDRAGAAARLPLPFLVALFALSFVPEISIHDPSNPRATDYLANFFLPSIFLLVFPGAAVALRVNEFMFNRSLQAAGLVCIALLIALLAMPAVQVARNYSRCDLKGEECAYVLGRRTLAQLPQEAVIVSKLVYGLLDAYFSEVERAVPPDKISLLDPEVVGRELARGGAGKDLFARKNRLMLDEISRRLAAGKAVFIAGDVVDEDKSPEKLLLSDLDLAPWRPNLPPEEACLVFPRELFLCRVAGLRGAQHVDGVPAEAPRGIANDGAFSNGMELLGFHPEPPDRGIRGDLLSLAVYWKTSAPVAGEIYAGIFFLDPMLRRIGEPCWHTVGGSFGPEKWETGAVVRERVDIYPPPLPPGRYLMAIGLVGADGERIGYLPRRAETPGRAYDYMVLVPYDQGAPPRAG